LPRRGQPPENERRCSFSRVVGGVSGVLLVFEGMEGAENQKRAVPGAFVVFKGRGRGRGGGANIRHVGHAHMGMFYMS